jgi:hypothetical protein
MPAEPVRRPESSYNVIYVLPPWAERSDKPRGWKNRCKAWFGGVLRSDTTRALMAQLLMPALIVVVVACLYVVLPDLYRWKSKSGIDLIPGIHGSDVLPFLKQ